jgi:outer membrane protein assembly factor BamB
MKVVVLLFCLITASAVIAQPVWQANLDSRIVFYQNTDFGILLAGTEKSLYAIDGQSGSVLWRRSTGKVNETSVAPIPDTDLILFSRDLGSRSRLEAIDLLSGLRIWQSEKVKGDVLQMAVDAANDLLAVVLVKDARGDQENGLKRKPVIHVLRLSDGEEVWKRDLDSEIAMMPSRFREGGGESTFTLDNYRAPLFLDRRLYLFYEGATSFDARTGKEKQRERFKVNEDGLALTEADPVIDGSHIYISGRGKIRAVDRRTGETDWTADDLGIAAEMILLGQTLYVRTGGQFTRLKDGEIQSKGPYGISAVDVQNGKVVWRYKGADKGLTNIVFPDRDVVRLADRDDLVTLDARSGKRISKTEHKIEKAQFLLLNEGGQTVIGGRDQLAAFDAAGREVWRVRHKAPGRGAFKIVAGIALRATALYFRYGSFATSAVGFARGGLDLGRALNSLRFSGLRSRFGSLDLTTLASNSGRELIGVRFYAYGSVGQNANLLAHAGDLQIRWPGVLSRISPTGSDVQDSFMDRLDPARQAEKLSDYLLRRKRLSELRGNYMYFYTDLDKPFDRKGLVGVNIHTGSDGRYILASDPDAEFITDDTLQQLYSADGSRLQAFGILDR